MKKYMDIENAKFDSVDLGGGIVRRSNTGGFQVGDHIVIQEKFDGSCASIQVNPDTKELEAIPATDSATTPSNTSAEYATTSNKVIRDSMEDEEDDNLYDDDHSSSDLLDIQKELEAKFDELFGPMDDDNN